MPPLLKIRSFAVRTYKTLTKIEVKCCDFDKLDNSGHRSIESEAYAWVTSYDHHNLASICQIVPWSSTDPIPLIAMRITRYLMLTEEYFCGFTAVIEARSRQRLSRDNRPASGGIHTNEGILLQQVCA